MSEPTFTIIVPSYNGGDYLKACVGAILAQNYAGFELAVLEDGSTDGSLEWLQEIDDPRLKLYPAGHLGIVENWARAVSIPKLEYITIVGQDDLLDQDYLKVMSALIRRFPDACLYHAHFRYIDEGTHLIRACGLLPERETAAEYIAALFSRSRDTYGTGYLMRSGDYDALGGIPHFEKLLFADDALWIAMMQLSYKATASEECFSCRLHTVSTGASAPWESWLNGMSAYISYLQNMAADDTAIATALARYAPAYFLQNAREIYMRAIVQATKANKHIAQDVTERIAKILAIIACEEVPKLYAFKESKPCRLRQFINATAITRFLYNSYIWARHGEWKGKRVR